MVENVAERGGFVERPQRRCQTRSLRKPRSDRLQLSGGCISIRACLLRFATGALDSILQFSRAALVLLSDLFELKS